jgi:predicted DNA-binding protein (MmcQ/YjbR family)
MRDAFDKIQAHCLAKPGAVQDEPWPGDTAFKVKGKIFAMGGHEAVTVKNTVERQEMLVMHPHVRKAAYVGRFGWVTVDLVNSEALELAMDLIDESYESVVAKKRKP